MCAVHRSGCRCTEINCSSLKLPEASSATHAFVNALLVVEKPGLAGAGALCLYALLALFVLAKLSKTALVAGSVHLGLGVHRLISLAQG